MGKQIGTDDSTRENAMRIDDMDIDFDRVLLDFLKRSAEEGLDLEQVTVNIFDEVFSDVGEGQPFDGTLSSFSLLMLDQMKLKRQLGSAMLDVIMPATVDGLDIYELIDRLESSLARKSKSPKKQKVTLATKQLSVDRSKPRTVFSMSDVSGIPEDSRHVLVIRSSRKAQQVRT